MMDSIFLEQLLHTMRLQSTFLLYTIAYWSYYFKYIIIDNESRDIVFRKQQFDFCHKDENLKVCCFLYGVFWLYNQNILHQTIPFERLCSQKIIKIDVSTKKHQYLPGRIGFDAKIEPTCILYHIFETLYYYYCSLAHMSRKANSSKNYQYEERIKSCFSKKNNKLADTPYENTYQKHSKSKIQTKRVNISQKKETKQKLGTQISDPQKTVEQLQNKGSSSATQKTILEECTKQADVQVNSTKVQEIFPKKHHESKDQLIKNCNLGPLKTLICQKLNDCDFFSGEENIRNSSKRLLFMEYKNQQLYINKSKQKSRLKEKVIPKDILQAFENIKSPKNYFSINSRIPTQQTYDTSDPSNYSKMTPPGLTPRSNKQLQSIPNRRNSFTFAPLNISEIEEQQAPNYYYPHHSYYYYGSFCGNQNPNFMDQGQHQRVKETQYKSFNIIVNKIQDDNRTTLMIKNIPNKYTREMLIQLFDRTHKRQYDFLYLPIDPENSCNIGYAFINFISCEHIKEFYQKFDGRKWESFNSEKICRLTYARMQGTSSLVEHIEITTPKHRKIKNFQQMNTSNLSTILQKQRQQKYE